VEIVRTGLELAKYVFEVHGVDAEEKVILRRTLRRDAVASFSPGCRPVSSAWRRAVVPATGRECRPIPDMRSA
jgi:hypothetical protein